MNGIPLTELRSRKAETYTMMYYHVYYVSAFKDGSMALECVDIDHDLFRCLPRWMYGSR